MCYQRAVQKHITQGQEITRLLKRRSGRSVISSMVRYKAKSMKHTDITRAEWMQMKDSIKRSDGVFDLRDLERAVMAKLNVDAQTAKHLVRRQDQQNTMTPRKLARFWNWRASK